MRRKKGFLLRLAAFLAIYCLVVEVLYLEIGNALLFARVPLRMLNRCPEVAQVEWDGAWTWFPGVLELENVRVRGQSGTNQWYTTVERGRVWMKLLPLSYNHFHTRWSRGHGVTFDLRRRLDKIDRPPVEVASWPPIPGLANPPGNPPERLYPPRKGRGWTITVDGCSFDHVRRIWIDGHRLDADGTAEGRLLAHIGDDIRLDRVAVRMPAARLLVGGLDIADALDVDAVVAIPTFTPGETNARAFWRKVTARALLRGGVRNLSFLNAYGQPRPWKHLDGSGRVDADVILRSGELQPDTRVSAVFDRISTSISAHEIGGAATLRGTVEPGTPPRGRLTVDVPAFAIRRGGADVASFQAGDFRFVVTSRGTDLTKKLDDLTMAFDLPVAGTARFEVQGADLPIGQNFRLGAGEGDLEAHLRMTTLDETGEGRISIHGRGIRGRYGGVPVRGDTSIRFDLASLAPDAPRGSAPSFAVPHARVEVRGLMAHEHEHPDWWSVLDFSAGRLDLKPRRFTARLDARLKDTAPIVSLFKRRGFLVRLFRPLMSVEDVTATADFTLDREALTVSDFALSAEKGKILADIRFADDVEDGIVYAKLGLFTFAIDMCPTGSEWKLHAARRWFEARRAARRASVPS